MYGRTHPLRLSIREPGRHVYWDARASVSIKETFEVRFEPVSCQRRQMSWCFVEEDTGMSMLTRARFFVLKFRGKVIRVAYLMESPIRMQEQSEIEKRQLNTDCPLNDICSCMYDLQRRFRYFYSMSRDLIRLVRISLSSHTGAYCTPSWLRDPITPAWLINILRSEGIWPGKQAINTRTYIFYASSSTLRSPTACVCAGTRTTRYHGLSRGAP